MNIKQTKTNKNKILKLFLIFVFIFGISFPVNAAPTQLHPEGNPEKQTTFQIQTNCTEGEALSYTTEQGLICKEEAFGTSTTTAQSEASIKAQEFLNIINSGDTNAQLAFEVDFCGNDKYLVGFTIEGDIRCLDKTAPQILNSYCGEGEVAVGFKKVTEKEVYQLNIVKTESLSTLSDKVLVITDLKTGEEIINIQGRNTTTIGLVDTNDNTLFVEDISIENPAISTHTPYIQIADSTSIQTAKDIASALPLYWKYSSIKNYVVSVSGATLNISKKDGSSVGNLAITTLESEFKDTTVTKIIEDIEKEYQLDNYKPNCLNLEDLLTSIPTTEKKADLLEKLSTLLSCEEGQIISSLPKENNLIVVGAPGDDDGGTDRGAVYIFEQQADNNWAQTLKISNNTGSSENINLDNNDSFGENVSYYDDVIVVGAPGDDDGGTDRGAVYIFEQQADNSWSKTLKISDNAGAAGELAVSFNQSNSDKSSSFGTSVSIEKDLLFVGVSGEQGSGTSEEGKNNGAVYIFEKSNSGDWYLAHKILDDDVSADITHINLSKNNFFGKSVFYSDNLLFVGANKINGVNNKGVVYVFEKGDSTDDWTKKSEITTNVSQSSSNFGKGISYKNGELLIGNSTNGTSTSTGAVYVFNREDDDTWTPDKRISYSSVPDTVFDLVVTQDFDNFTGGVFRPGLGVSNSNSLILLGSETAVSTSEKGGVMIYRKERGGSLVREYVFADAPSTSTTLNVPLDTGDRFGRSVSLNRYPSAGEWTCIDEPGNVVISLEYETKVCKALLKDLFTTKFVFAGNLNGTSTKRHNLLLPYNTDVFYKGEVHTNASYKALSNKADVNIRKTDETTSSPLLENQTLDHALYVIEVTGKDTSYTDGYTINITPTFNIDSSTYTEACTGFVAGDKQPITENSFYVSILSKDFFNIDDDKKITILSSKDATFEVKAPCSSPTGTNLNAQTDKEIELVKANGDPLDTYTKYNCNIEVTSDDGDVTVKTIPEFSILNALNINNYDKFAEDIAISDSYVAFGAYGHEEVFGGGDNSGAVYLFEKPDNSDGKWKKRIKFSDNKGGDGEVAVSLDTVDHFGRSVALSDDTLVVGAHADDDGGNARGAVYIFEKDSNGEWEQTLKISDNGGGAGLLDIDLDNGDKFGQSVGYSTQGVLVVGAHADDDGGYNRGAVYVFGKDSNGDWKQTLKISDNGGGDGLLDVNLGDSDFFGSSTAIYADTSERTIVVGAPGSTSTDTGAVYVIERQSNGVWEHTNTISRSATGAQDTQIDLDNYDLFGSDIGIYKDTLVVSAEEDDDGGADKGAVYVFEKESILITAPVCEKIYYCSNSSEDSYCGVHSLIGSTCYPPRTRNGACLSYPATPVTVCTSAVYKDRWILKNKISENSGGSGETDISLLGLGVGSSFGHSLGIYDDLLIVGESNEGGQGLYKGAAHIFKISGDEFNFSETISDGYPDN